MKIIAASALAAAALLAGPVARGDEDELAAIRAQSPRAAELLQRGEALVAAGALAEADAVFQQAHDVYPESSLPWRRDCEVKTALGQRREAILACSEALERRHSEPVKRALVSALVDGPSAPTSTDLYQAWLVTDAARKNPIGQVTAAATTCDLAERIGDGIMLEECDGVLERIAPEDPATRRAGAALSAFGPRAPFWIGWGAVLAAVVLTVIDGLRRIRHRARAIAALTLVVLLAGPSPARADGRPAPGQNLSKWPINMEHPEDFIPPEQERNADPLQFGYWIQDVAANAEHASKQGDHETAVKLYAALGKAVPDRAISYVKTCEEYEVMGDLSQAANACGQAILRDGVHVSDYTRFVHLMLTKPGDLRDKDIAALAMVLDHMKKDPTGAEAAADLECQVGTRTSNVLQLRECTGALAAKAPDDPKTITYLWALAVAEGRFDDARKLGERAKAAGVSDDGVEAMRRATASNESRHQWTILSLFAAAVFVAGIAFLSRRVWKLVRPEPQLDIPVSTQIEASNLSATRAESIAD
jgi:tetratricopeptide (TPR) repeat protein